MDRNTLLILLCSVFSMTNSKKMNVLFFASDDMRPEINFFAASGRDFPSPVHPKMHTPNLDALAAKSLVLKRAYVQQAVCSPSRTSLLTGRRPDTTHVYNLVDYFRKVGGNFTTIPQHFKNNGYISTGMGKIFHPGVASDNDDPISWSVPYYHAPNLAMYSTKNASWVAVNATTRKAAPLPDEQVADNAIKTLRQFAAKSNEKYKYVDKSKESHKFADKSNDIRQFADKSNDIHQFADKSNDIREFATANSTDDNQPFFLAVGFHKPHLPFVFPEEYLQFYPRDAIRVPDNQFAPEDMPEIAWTGYGELRSYADIKKLHASGQPNTTLPASVVMDLRRAYYRQDTCYCMQRGL